MNKELYKQAEEYDADSAGKALIQLLVAALKEKERECESLKIDLRSEKHSRALDSANPLDYV